MPTTTFQCKVCSRTAEDFIAPYCRHGDPEKVATRMVPRWFAQQEPRHPRLGEGARGFDNTFPLGRSKRTTTRGRVALSSDLPGERNGKGGA